MTMFRANTNLALKGRMKGLGLTDDVHKGRITHTDCPRIPDGHQWSPLTCPGVVRLRVNTPLIIRESGPRSCEHQLVSLLMEMLTEDMI